ncbi:hypothetical protein [Mesorhizobium sp. M0488]|uniref:hypothetical protein n=1 Tax=unclassified Mesorhizobium TaxID=325217 RepID=UPI003338DA56
MHIEQLNALTKARLMVIEANSAVQAAALSLSKPGIGLVVICGETERRLAQLMPAQSANRLLK